MKKFFLILGIILLVLLSIYFFFFRGTSLVWNTYNNPKVPFSFKYPSNWSICEEFYPNLNSYSVHIFEGRVDCEKNLSKGRYLLISSELLEGEQETDIKTYLLKSEQEFIKDEQLNRQKGRVPSTPGFTWQFVKYVKGLLLVRGASVAQVEGLTPDIAEYVILYKNHVYNIMLGRVGILESLPLRLILWTVRLGA